MPHGHQDPMNSPLQYNYLILTVHIVLIPQPDQFLNLYNYLGQSLLDDTFLQMIRQA